MGRQFKKRKYFRKIHKIRVKFMLKKGDSLLKNIIFPAHIRKNNKNNHNNSNNHYNKRKKNL